MMEEEEWNPRFMADVEIDGETSASTFGTETDAYWWLWIEYMKYDKRFHPEACTDIETSKFELVDVEDAELGARASMLRIKREFAVDRELFRRVTQSSGFRYRLYTLKEYDC